MTRPELPFVNGKPRIPFRKHAANTPDELAAVIRKETPEWAKVIKDAGIKLGN